MITFHCTKCGKELVTFRDIFLQFKTVKTFKLELIETFTANSRQGTVLCEDCGHKFDAWLKEGSK